MNSCSGLDGNLKELSEANWTNVLSLVQNTSLYTLQNIDIHKWKEHC